MWCNVIVPMTLGASNIVRRVPKERGGVASQVKREHHTAQTLRPDTNHEVVEDVDGPQ